MKPSTIHGNNGCGLQTGKLIGSQACSLVTVVMMNELFEVYQLRTPSSLASAVVVWSIALVPRYKYRTYAMCHFLMQYGRLGGHASHAPMNTVDWQHRRKAVHLMAAIQVLYCI